MQWVLYYRIVNAGVRLLTKTFTTEEAALRIWDRMLTDPENFLPQTLIKEEIVRVSGSRP